jgi:hypothetical protein
MATIDGRAAPVRSTSQQRRQVVLSGCTYTNSAGITIMDGGISQ